MRSRARIIKMAECGTWRVQVKMNSRYRKCLNWSRLKMRVGNRDEEVNHVWKHGSIDRSLKGHFSILFPISSSLFLPLPTLRTIFSLSLSSFQYSGTLLETEGSFFSIRAFAPRRKQCTLGDNSTIFKDLQVFLYKKKT